MTHIMDAGSVNSKSAPSWKADAQVEAAASDAAGQVSVLYESRPSSLSRCFRHASLM